VAVTVRSPWGDRPPRRPKVGAGRSVLAKRAKGRGRISRGARDLLSRAQERRRTEAARRGLSRGRRRGGWGKRFGPPVRGAAAQLTRFYGIFEQKFLIRQRLRTILLTLAAIWALWTFGIGDAGVVRLLHVKHQNAELVPEIEKLTEEEATLDREVRALTDPEDQATLEKVAREQHALVKDGEVLVRFYGEGEEGEK